MKWILAVSGFVLVLTLGVAVIGSLLPVRHRATRRAHFHQPPSSLYAVLAGPPDWRSDVKASGPLPDQNGRKQWWEEDAHGQRVTFELLEDSPPSGRVVKIADQHLPFGGTWSFEIAAAAGGSDLRITEDGEVYNVIFRFMSRYILGYTGSIERFFRDLGKKFGESPQTEARLHPSSRQVVNQPERIFDVTPGKLRLVLDDFTAVLHQPSLRFRNVANRYF